MEPTTVYMDFSRIHITKAERRLLSDVCKRPQKKTAMQEEAEHLCELGLAERFDPADHVKSKSPALFSTQLGKSYLEYSKRMRRQKRLDFLKWIVPLLISIAALILAIRANGTGAASTTARTTAQTTQTTQATATPAPASTAAPAAQPSSQSGAATSSAAGAQSSAGGMQTSNGGTQSFASGEPSGESGAAP